ncbi:hypothetical protein BGZ76_001795 [Entomortierella beljakovae]|nr:hypothetical protein BGZ76_001795 [Entomortierella beljakovae]
MGAVRQANVGSGGVFPLRETESEFVKRFFGNGSFIDSDANEKEGVQEAERVCRVPPILDIISDSLMDSKEGRVVRDSDTDVEVIIVVEERGEGKKKGDEEDVVEQAEVEVVDADDVDDAEHEETQDDRGLLESWDGTPETLWCRVWSLKVDPDNGSDG